MVAAVLVLMTETGPGYFDSLGNLCSQGQRGQGRLSREPADVSKCRCGGGHQAAGTAISCLSTLLTKVLTPHNKHDAIPTPHHGADSTGRAQNLESEGPGLEGSLPAEDPYEQATQPSQPQFLSFTKCRR